MLYSPLLVDLGRETDDREGREKSTKEGNCTIFSFHIGASEAYVQEKFVACAKKGRGKCSSYFGELLQLIMKYCLFIKA